ncbi:MAG: BON domain-containing protein [Acidobacteriia bacterium]|nr:BON domain-containing protein [Terriglobia bacterium]
MGKEFGARFLIAGIGVGAGWMYLMDPDRGKSRRAVLRDKAASACRQARTSADRAGADLTNRAHGWIANAKSIVQHEPVDDDQLVARVRARLGRLASHPHAIDVIAHDGKITLSGAVLEHEAAQLLSGVGSIRGVSLVCDHLLRHRDAFNVPTLQGGRERNTERPGLLRCDWPPAARMLTGVAAASLGFGLLARIASQRKRSLRNESNW